MDILLTEDFSRYAPIGGSLANAQSVFDIGWILHTTGNGAITVSEGFEIGTKAVTMTRATNSSSYIEYRVSTTEPEELIIIGYEFRTNARATVFRIKDVVELEWDVSTARLKIGSNVGPVHLLLNTAYYIEFRLNKTTKEVTIRVNGLDYMSVTLDSSVTIPATLQAQWGWFSGGPNASMALSNVYIGRTNVASEWLGVIGLLPMTVATSLDTWMWDPTPASKTNVEIMQNIPPRINEYTSSNVAGEADLYKSDTVVSGTVLGVTVSAFVGKTDVDDQTINLVLNDMVSDNINVPIQPTVVQHTFLKNGTDDWTSAAAQDATFGVMITIPPM